MVTWRGRFGLLAIALFFAFGTSCFPMKRAPRTSVSAAGGYSRAEHETLDCGSNPVQRHHQYGGLVEVRHETDFGLTAGGRGQLLAGELDESVDLMRDPDLSPYFIPGIGGFVGYDFPFVGGEFGLTGVADFDTPRDQQAFIVVPYARGRFGDYELVSLEAQVGSRTAFAFDTRLLALGVGLRQPWLDLHAGLGFGGRLMVDQERGGIIIGSRHTLDFTVYLEGELEVVDRFWITFGGQIGEQWPTALLGVRYDIEAED